MFAMSSNPNRMSISQMASAKPPAAKSEAEYLDGLNPEQREAVLTTEGPLLVLAGAGTGKTRVLTTRLAHIIGTRLAWPSQTLTVTFTNKAAREMRERALSMLGEAGEGLRWLGTFHSISAQILRKHAELAGLKSTFTIIDTDDQIRLCKQIIQAENIDPKRWTPRYLASLIDGWKNRALVPNKVPPEEAHQFADGKGITCYQIYQARLKVLNACDFGDLLIHNIQIFQNNPDLLKEYHDKFRYILVDEYQDTNVAQYLWLRLLAQGSQNICCVGDDDQSIYGWRGAEVDNILRFEKDFPGAHVIRLEKNYRSTKHILAAASSVISHNRSRLGKTLYVGDDNAIDDIDASKVKVRGLWDGEAESRLIADDIESWVSKGGSHEDCAVLVRASWQMRAFEERFIMLGIPYRVIGGPRFFERAEIRDALAYLRLIRSPDDDLAFERVVNQPKRGIGNTSLAKLQSYAREDGRSLFVLTPMVLQTDEIKGGAKRGLTQFIDQINLWRDKLTNGMPHTELAETILEESGYTDMLQKDRSPQAQTRLDNLKELVRAMGEFDSLAGFLEHIELVMDASTGGAGEDQVQILTLHGAKGLEWPVVFLPGWEEEVFPSRRSLDESGMKGLEEERRLAYVGITRARQHAYISFVANRQIYGRWQSVLPSRFVDELPHEHVEAVSETGYSGIPGGDTGFTGTVEDLGERSNYKSPGWQRLKENAG
ncbi:MAG TPA: DNA helicase II, partial [Hyphomonas atlantica]|nr:DNA helicase II [Hyphomonas atlantica]